MYILDYMIHDKVTITNQWEKGALLNNGDDPK